MRLARTAHEKIWGTPRTEPWYRNPGQKQIGEVWFAASDSVPLLVKFLFTSANLSVQVHPDDSYAQKHGEPRGKTEMWHVLRADPDARVALGFKDSITSAQLRESCENGRIVELLNWVPARAGDTFFTPAGTVHAIGGGLAICEIQQYSDTTYRLYDHGRAGRELHLDHGVMVSHLGPHQGLCTRHATAEGRELLAECEYFHTARLTVSGTVSCPAGKRNTIYVAIEGAGEIAGSGFSQGDAFEIPAGQPVAIESPGATFLVTSQP